MDIILSPGGLLLLNRDKREPCLSGRTFKPNEVCDVHLCVSELEQIVAFLNEKRHGFIESTMLAQTIVKFATGKTPVADAIAELERDTANH